MTSAYLTIHINVFFIFCINAVRRKEAVLFTKLIRNLLAHTKTKLSRIFKSLPPVPLIKEAGRWRSLPGE